MSRQVAVIFALQMTGRAFGKTHLLFASPALAKAIVNFAAAP
jgi:hypothetical protein